LNRNYIGLASSQHDSAIAVVDSKGEVLFAEANERPLKNKRAWNVPPDSMARIGSIVEEFCDPNADLVASLSWSATGVRWSPWIHRLARFKSKFQQTFSSREKQVANTYSLQNIRQSMYKAPQNVSDMLLNLEYRFREADGFDASGRQLIRRGQDHHLCHAATACYTTDSESDAICVVIDGMGEGVCVSCYLYQDGNIVPLSRKPATGRKDQSLYELMRPMLEVRGPTLHQCRDYSKRSNRLLKLRDQWSSPDKAADLAHTGQLVFVELVCELLTEVHRRWGGDRLILGGGCALNSACNGQILERTPFKSLHVPMSPGDDGTSFGAALLAWKSDHLGERPPVCRSPYLGSELSKTAIKRVCELGGLRAKLFSCEADLVDRVADLLAEGCLVGWAHQRVKFREEFRPFAPSILHEFGNDYFEHYQPSPYMERTLKFSRPHEVPGVVHHDGTGRLQSVTQELNPRFYSLIKAFREKTGVPMLLNTSLNVMGRPIVHDVEDAVGLFFTTGLDVLVLNDHVFVKEAD